MSKIHLVRLNIMGLIQWNMRIRQAGKRASQLNNDIDINCVARDFR